MDTVTTKTYLWGMFRNETKAPKISKTDKHVITQLVTEFQDRSRSDIVKWREALEAAENPENPRWALLQDLLENLMTDGHLMAVIDIRKAAVLGNRFYIEDANGTENDEATKLLKTKWFYNLLDVMLDSVYLKYSVVELVDPITMKFELVPRRNVVPKFERIYLEVFGDKFVSYKDPYYANNILAVESNSKFGIMNDIVPQLIWKRNAQQTWADFSEKFGIPLVTAETFTTDKKKLDLIETMLRNLGQAAQAILPEGTKITIHDASTKGDPHNVFSEQIKVTNAEISKRIVGGSMITDDGSSRSQSEVHERTLDYKLAENDRRMIEFVINDDLFPILRANGIKLADTERFVFDRSEDLSLSQLWTIAQGIMSQYDIDQDWLSRKFNIPITAKKAQAGSPVLPNTGTKAFTKNFR